MALAYAGSVRLVGRLAGRDPVDLAPTFLGVLVPVAFAFMLSHYLSLFVIEGQGAVALLSDPFGEGWDLFGTASWTIDADVVSTATIGLSQVAILVVGILAALTLVHDRGVAALGPARVVRSLYSLAATTVAFTLLGLALLISV